MEPLVGAAAISAGSNLVGGIMGGIGAGRRQKRAHAQQMKLAEYAYSKDLEMWNRENAYNHPTAQMQRLKAAGINPHMAYGNGSITNVASGTLPQYNAPELDFSAPSGLETLGGSLAGGAESGISNYINLKSMQRQDDLAASKIKKERLEYDIANLEYELQRDVYNPEAMLQWASRKKEYHDYMTDAQGNQENTYQRNRRIEREKREAELLLKKVDKEIRDEIKGNKKLMNEYQDFINAITVRKEIDPRENPMYRRMLMQIDKIKDVDVRSWMEALVSFGGLIFGK